MNMSEVIEGDDPKYITQRWEGGWIENGDHKEENRGLQLQL